MTAITALAHLPAVPWLRWFEGKAWDENHGKNMEKKHGKFMVNRKTHMEHGGQSMEKTKLKVRDV